MALLHDARTTITSGPGQNGQCMCESLLGVILVSIQASWSRFISFFCCASHRIDEDIYPCGSYRSDSQKMMCEHTWISVAMSVSTVWRNMKSIVSRKYVLLFLTQVRIILVYIILGAYLWRRFLINFCFRINEYVLRYTKDERSSSSDIEASANVFSGVQRVNKADPRGTQHRMPLIFGIRQAWGSKGWKRRRWSFERQERKTIMSFVNHVYM